MICQHRGKCKTFIDLIKFYITVVLIKICKFSDKPSTKNMNFCKHTEKFSYESLHWLHEDLDLIDSLEIVCDHADQSININGKR